MILPEIHADLTTEDGELVYLMGVHIGTGLLACCPEFWPSANRVGLVLLRRTIELALASEGLLVPDAPVVGAGELNDSIIHALVVRWADAVEVVKRELTAAVLLDVSQIGIREGEEWRCVHPSPAVRLNWLLDSERIEHSSTNFQLIARSRLAAIRLQGSGGADQQAKD